MYGYQELSKDIENFKMFAEVGSIGKSRLGRDIFYIRLSLPVPCAFCPVPSIIITGGIHAREHITAKLVSALVYEYGMRKERKKRADLRFNIYFIPLVNPDGAEMCLRGGLPLWKANAAGVDLNVNFPARWGTGKQNVLEAGSENYIGGYPLCEPESRALARFTEFVCPRTTLSYHCKGREIYWQFYQDEAAEKRDFMIAKKLEAETGYKLVDAGGSAGGYKDFCIERLKIPAFTIEVGDDKYSHPFPYSEFERIFCENRNVPWILSGIRG